jgi:hypothetical protein
LLIAEKNGFAGCGQIVGGEFAQLESAEKLVLIFVESMAGSCRRSQIVVWLEYGERKEGEESLLERCLPYLRRS